MVVGGPLLDCSYVLLYDYNVLGAGDRFVEEQIISVKNILDVRRYYT